MICNQCGSENPNSNWYCESCGESLRGATDTIESSSTVSDSRTAPSTGTTGKRKEPLFAERYDNLEKIGEGAMATVYRAHDTVLGTLTALKVLHPDLAVNRRFVERFQRETALARKITHPNIYRIYDIGSHSGQSFISMEYIEGMELKSMLDEGPLDFAKGLEICIQIAGALETAHSHGIIHRDLKPQNIMIEKGTGRCVVMDFGIAFAGELDHVTQAGAVLGTPDYISPELARGENADNRADIYSFGVILYEIFCGRLPFQGKNLVSMALNHISAKPVRPGEVNPKIPADLEKIIVRCLEKNPAKRYQNATSLIQELSNVSILHLKKQSDPVTQTHVDVHSSANPYFNRKMIRDFHYFFGRRKEIDTIYSRIGADRPQSVSIVGERRIGKSSLLNYLFSEENRRRYLHNPISYICVFVDFQEKRRASVEDFFKSIFDALEKAVAGRIDSLPEPGYDGFKDFCETIDSQDMKLVLFFDEFESITRNRNFDPEFYSFLRSLANNYNVAYVTSSVRNLQELCHNREISDSPFFNIFTNIHLSVFTRDEAFQFVDMLSQETGHPLSEHFEIITELAGFFPFYMAIACSVLWDFDFANADSSKTVIENIEDLFLDESMLHFKYIINNLEQAEKKTIHRLLSASELDEMDRYVIRDLVKKGYLIRDPHTGEFRVFSRILGDMLKRELRETEN